MSRKKQMLRQFSRKAIRPVSLTVVLCKVMEYIICSNVMKHLDRNNILTDAQHGFRKRRSCESQLILTVKDLASSLDLKEQIDLILLYFSKAFDKVPHERLLYKMEYYGIRGHMNSWIRDSRKQTATGCVRGSNIYLSTSPIWSSPMKRTWPTVVPAFHL